VGIDGVALLDNQGMVLFARLFVASVFVMASLGKLTSRKSFASDVMKYGVLPKPLALAYAHFLPWAELLAGALLFGGVFVVVGATLSIAMLLSFMVGIAVALHRQLNLQCGCFGLLYREKVGPRTLARDGVLLLLSIEVLVFDQGRFALSAVVSELDQPANVVAFCFTIACILASVGVSVVGWVRYRQAVSEHERLGRPVQFSE